MLEDIENIFGIKPLVGNLPDSEESKKNESEENRKQTDNKEEGGKEENKNQKTN